ncbi:penicillinase repressor : Probable Penicillinase repressor OS=Planctomyces maris DSM 8797 GN=PM8797T_09109 PE=4 SV=1: Penicillinase_R [Gemmata massiliana]|uniref:BlaI/MecI/CopY family transcriptional regulator n=1 Tax=Gemmata massiliana TaxID=1210884 RepID=A0A6P2CZ07_9BACT|nr:BlaI/MecI/CopY family transcriptional regulator [Gemmata massiliana]VTR94211.1 penicillinase repressor : Probable Penicillinase repressor OS=Planctomyces maris DSM 8797 GN=PM8797T_09109 PE=4 SV=1: Penicillinase_R [Gemmata massiliana]
MTEREADGLPALSEVQMEIMHAVWAGGEVTVTDVWTAVAARRPVARNTVLTLMDRLVTKGWLTRRADGPAFRYAAAVSRATALGGAVRRLVDSAFAGSADALVLALIEGRGVTDDEAHRIRQLIDAARKTGDKS